MGGEPKAGVLDNEVKEYENIAQRKSTMAPENGLDNCAQDECETRKNKLDTYKAGGDCGVCIGKNLYEREAICHSDLNVFERLLDFKNAMFSFP